MKSEIDPILIQILGTSALNNDMEVEADTGKLCKAISYLYAQLQITKNFCDGAGKQHVEDVTKTTLKILRDDSKDN